MNEEKNKNIKVENKDIKDDNKGKKVVKKIKKRKLKVGYILAFLVLAIVIIFVLKLVLPSGVSKYGNRLDGIDKITFGDTEKKAIVDKLKSDARVTDAKVDVKGRIIYIIFNVNNEATKQNAIDFGGDVLSAISDEVKGYYDIQYIVTKKDEVGEKVTETKEDGTTEEVTVTEFPIMGSKNRKNAGIVW